MGKAEQRCGQASSVAILRQKNLSRTICRGEQFARAQDLL